MRKFFCIFLLIILSNICFAQTGSQRREYRDDPRLTASQNAGRRAANDNRNKAIGIAGEANARSRSRGYVIRLPITKFGKNLIKPEKSLRKSYSAELKSKNTKMIKLLNINCELKHYMVEIDEINKRCITNIPSNGAFYSFRKKRHSYSAYADIQIAKGWFVSSGDMVQGLMTSIGKADFSAITLNDARLKYLKDFTPATNPNDVLRQETEIENGITVEGFDYHRAAEIKVDEVYALRSVAYKSKLHSKDKRRDIIVVFKVLKKDLNGDVVLIWKTLQNKDAPKLKM